MNRIFRTLTAVLLVATVAGGVTALYWSINSTETGVTSAA